MPIEDRVVAVSGGAGSPRISWPAGSAPPATIDTETRTVTPRGDGVRADLVEWLRTELDEDLLTLLRERFRLVRR